MNEFLKGFFALGLLAGISATVLFFVFVVGVDYCPLLPCSDLTTNSSFSGTDNIDLRGLKVQEDIAHSSNSMARAAWVTIVVGTISAGILIFTLSATQKAVAASVEGNQIAADANKRSLRAYVNVAKTEVLYEDGKTTLRVTLRNSGATPAKGMEFVSRGEFSWFPKDHSPGLPRSRSGGSKTTLARGEDFIVPVPLSRETLGDLSFKQTAENPLGKGRAEKLEEISSLFRGLLEDCPDLFADASVFQQRLTEMEDFQRQLQKAPGLEIGFTFSMLITYRDIYGAKRKSLYKGFITLGQLKDKKEMLEICPKHNYTT